MSKYIFLSIICLCGIVCSHSALAQIPNDVPQVLEGKKIAIDPGHGGHDSDDREVPLGNGFTYWESEGVWEMALLLEDILKASGADVMLTKTNNDPNAEDRDPSLAERVAVANAYDADYMHSIHTNAGGGAANYTLLLYRGENNVAAWKEAEKMGGIMTQKLHEYMYTTDAYNRADKDFLPYHLGVLNGTKMPSTLSEGSFHDHKPEGKRLMSSLYRKAAAWAIFKSFLTYFNAPSLPYGEVGGLVRSGLGKPINGVKVTINPDTPEAKVITVDNADGGYYLFDWLDKGTYTLRFEKEEYGTVEHDVIVSEGGYTKTDVTMINMNEPPTGSTLLSVQNPLGGSSLSAKWTNGIGATAYRLYYAEDDDLTSWKLAANEETLTDSTFEVILESANDFTEVPTSQAKHFKVIAIKDNGKGEYLESVDSDIYSRSENANGKKALIVDGFDRFGSNGSYQFPTHDFATAYLNAIPDDENLRIETVANELIANDDIQLTDYDIVFWFLGDESTDDETFSAKEQLRLKEFLENGGYLFVSGSEVGWDLWQKGNSSDQTFFTNYLKAEFIDDGSADLTPARGEKNTHFENLVVNFGRVYPEDYPDVIAAVDGANNVLKYSQGGKAGVSYEGQFGTGTKSGKLIYISFPLETVEKNERATLMQSVMDFFNGIPIDSEVPNEILASDENKSINVILYPHPVSEYVKIKWEAEDSGSVQINIFKLSGEQQTSQSFDVTKGEQLIELSTSSLPKGMYILQLIHANSKSTYLKMLKD
ncbi:N-acetylmuramoyl-L-alanine amidase [Sediminitomix flava]|uniref:N-acetylmuramoyl-L-alanine amidase n=1 Tax=Sediminitomix flava TaxID=379075 RepID=A0A315ZE91_SEDFL|nr:N-acetylmuramoyl-L-alanine amidase [Sediminitomix flava]PWJ43851.1 putative secreted protein (Por secretion system target) [Sediminitomix flava]